MKIIGIGVDLLAISRISDLVARRGVVSFAKRILSDHELGLLKSCHDPVNFLQTRFAVKEALFKATSSYKHLRWDEVSIVKEANGKPNVIFHKEPELHAETSISHDQGFLVAMALVTRSWLDYIFIGSINIYLFLLLALHAGQLVEKHLKNNVKVDYQFCRQIFRIKSGILE